MDINDLPDGTPPRYRFGQVTKNINQCTDKNAEQQLQGKMHETGHDRRMG